MPNQPDISKEQLAANRKALLEKLITEQPARRPEQTTDLSSASLSKEDLRNLEKLKQLMGVDFIGAEDWQKIFGKSVSGDFAPPAKLISFLNEDCKFVPGKKIHETHVVCLIPETLDGKPYSINDLSALANALPAKEGQTRVVYEGSNNEKDAWRLNAGASLYPSQPIKGGRYVLLPKEEIREFLEKNAANQQVIFDASPDKYKARGYEIGDAGAVSAALIMRYLKATKGGMEPDKARLLNKWMYLRCKDAFNYNGRACRAAVGSYYASGLDVYYDYDDDADGGLALAVLRNFKNT